MKEKYADTVFYRMLIVLLIMTIIAIGILLYLDDDTPDSFSAVSFLDPEELPTLTRVGNTYKADYMVQSFENETKEYEITSILELYRLYDVTEGLYSCLSPYRRKIYLTWDNETNLSRVSIPNENEIIPDILIIPDFSNLIEWDTYHYTFQLGRTYGKGELIIWYGSENKSQYEISINALSNEVMLNGKKVGNVELAKQNDWIKIDYVDNELSLTFNDEKIFTETIEDASKGQFGFETRDMFITLNLMRVQRDEFIEVPDNENIWEYSVDNNLYFSLLSDSREKTEKDIDLRRNYIENDEFYSLQGLRSESPAKTDELGNIILPSDKEEEHKGSTLLGCANEFACNYLRTDNEEFVIDENNLTNLMYYLPRTTYGTSFWLSSDNKTESLIPWYDFEYDARYRAMTEKDNIAFFFGDNFGLFFTNKSYSTMEIIGNKTVIKQYPRVAESFEINSGVTKEDNFSMKVRGKNIDLIVGNSIQTFEIQEDLFNKSVKMFHHNTFSTIREVNILNLDDSCKGDEVYTFCSINYKFTSVQGSTAQPEISDYGSLIGSDFIDEDEEYFVPEVFNFEETIPSKKLVFDGPLSLVRNSTNRTFHVRYYYLDGDGEIIFKFNNLNGSSKIKVTNLVNKNQIVVEGEEDEVFVNRAIDAYSWSNIDIDLNENNITFKHNGTVVADLPIETDSGYFSIETENTHVELRNVYIKDRTTGRATSIPLFEDPCRLRPIHREIIRKENFTLESEMNKTFSNLFTLEDFFDYGKFSVSLNGSSNNNNTPLDIQFWMVRT